MASSKVDLRQLPPRMLASSIAPLPSSDADPSTQHSQDILQTSRPLTQRPSLSSSLSGISNARQSHSRNNSHTTISGPLTTGNRVARRKSVSNNTANAAVVAAVAAIGDIHDKVPALPISIGNRRTSRSGGLRPEASGLGGLPSPPASMPAQKLLNMERNLEPSDSAVDDQEAASTEENESSDKVLLRRGSDGQPLAKEGRKFNRPEIHCQHCGKGYKHSSCLTKHLFVPLSSSFLTPPSTISPAGAVSLGPMTCC